MSRWAIERGIDEITVREIGTDNGIVYTDRDSLMYRFLLSLYAASGTLRADDDELTMAGPEEETP